jgi:hypothetical protein
MQDAPWFIPAKVIQLADGSTLVKPGKAIQRAKAAQVARMTGVHRKTLAALAECGLIRRCYPSPNCAHYYPAEVEEILRRTEADPAFWTAVKSAAFLQGRSLRHSDPST